MNESLRATATRMRALVLALVAVAGACVWGCGGGSEASGEPASGAGSIPQPTQAQLAAGGLAKLPVAPQSERIDVAVPSFSDSTSITNPLFPISDLDSAILSGRVDGKPFHTETTLLPQTRFIEWTDGELVETAVSQYIAYLDGRIEEAALDYYAQADDGSVWYLGEDVFDYNEQGLIDGTEGTWLAGNDGPMAMIMPGDPQIGDVHRAENIPSVAFEEVEIKTVEKTVDGPAGQVEGAIVARELHDDGSFSDKVFAPGYGEFFSAHEGDVEAMALALPTDVLPGPVPPELEALYSEPLTVTDATLSGDWQAAADGAATISHAWKSLPRNQTPPRLATEMERAVDELTAASAARDPEGAANAAIDVAQSALDLQLRHLPPAQIDLARFGLWAQQILVHFAAGDIGGINGDVATIEWIRDRFARSLESADLTRIDKHLQELRGSVVDREPDAAQAEARRLLETLTGLDAG